MKGDFTRWTFNPTKHYHGVLKQQGRVDLDADTNEQGAIAVHRVETEATDVIGASGAPVNDAGFLLSVVNNKLQIAKGRAYVDGLLCENEQAIAIDAQPDLPGFQIPTAAGMYVAYLTVWLRHLTPLDDPEMREAALGGADTCTRAKTVWQVNLAQPSGALGSGVSCTTAVPALEPVVPATLMAQAIPTAEATKPCAIPAQAGYLSLENQLYRVEVHNAGDIGSGKVTFKWSRDNGSVVTSWTGQPDATTLSVADAGRDSVLGFAAGQWVELTDDVRELTFQPGTLVQLTNVQGLKLTIDPKTATGTTDFTQFTKNPKVRRWDSAGLVTVPKAGQWLDLENGVQVNFGAGTCQFADYWLIPARTLTASIDWPQDGGNPVAVPPTGIRRHFARLAVVQFDGTNWSVVTRCLPLFPPLTAITQGQGIHVTDVQIRTGASFVELPNDSSVPLLSIEGPWDIRVFCDAPIDPVSAQPTTCILTIEIPYPLDVQAQLPNPPTGNVTIFGYHSLILPAQVSVTSNETANTIDLTLTPTERRFLYSVLRATYLSRMVVRLTLKGDFIWGKADPSLYLDGAAFGVARQDSDGTHIGLKLPRSGNGTSGSDFNMWFWLSRPVKVTSVTMSPNPVTVGQTANGTIMLDGYAPSNATITLTANPNLGTLNPAAVPIAAGQFDGFFSVTNTSVPAGAGSATMTVTATYAGSTASGTLTINQPIKLTGVTFNTNLVLEETGGNTTATVTLNLPAPANGATVTLTSSKPGNLPVPASVLIPPNQTSVTFKAVGTGVPSNNSVDLVVTASYAGSSVQANVTVKGPYLG